MMTSQSGVEESTMTSLHQVETGPEGAVLECKLGRDEQTGLPFVEMTFSVDSVQQAPSYTWPAVEVFY